MVGNPQEYESSHLSASAPSTSTSPSRISNATNVPLSIRANMRIDLTDDDNDIDDENGKDDLRPLLDAGPPVAGLHPSGTTQVRARKSRRRRHRPNWHRGYNDGDKDTTSLSVHWLLLWICRSESSRAQWAASCFRFLWRLFLWTSIVILVIAVFWYSYELHKNETEPIKIAWFSAGAFVLLTFPISMYGIIMHLSHYNQPLTQMYIVRILWMVPIYSIESWLAMRFHEQAIYIETLRDFYESYVLYSFLQFLIQVLGGEESLILMLKDKSPTRGFHMWGLQFFIKPWIMGQPVRKTVYERAENGRSHRSVKRVHWISPFFIRCKFGVLQYVLLKFLSAIVVLILEWKGLYKEGDFSWSSGYLYICIITNLSQCWALYCMIFFYYATKNELAPIRPVGKFLSVKALVFFTWWQSVVLAILYQWGMIPEQLVNIEQNYTEEDAAKGIQDYLICIEMFVAALVHSFVFPHTEYLSQAVRARNRALQSNQGERDTSNTLGKWKSRRLGRSKFHPQSYSRSWIMKDDASKTSAQNGLEMKSLGSGVDARSIETWEDSLMWQNVQPQQEEPNPRSRTCSLEDPWEFSTQSEIEIERRGETRGEKGENDALSPVRDDSSDEEVGDLTMDGDEEYLSSEGDDSNESENEGEPHKPGFIRALIDSAIPRDLGDSTLGIVKGDYHVEKKTLLSVATTSDQYDLFSVKRIPRKDIPP